MPLDKYQSMRDFSQTPEPSGDAAAVPPRNPWTAWDELAHGKRFCVQMHRATRMHWDVRLEYGGVLLSWAVPRGPSLDPTQKRLAMHVEDHPIDYGCFEGVIPSGYGMGTVLLWDVGTYEWAKESAEDEVRQIVKGDIKFRLNGVKLTGEFALVKIGGRRPTDDENAWLMLKKRDDAVVDGYEARNYEESVRSGRDLARIAADGGGDPRQRARSARAARPTS